jgi:acylphosphatase
MKKALRIYLSGQVQGVAFRTFVKESASEFGVSGFARNLEDGRVEIFIEGDLNDVIKMVEVCKKGPKFARITNIESKEERMQGFANFKILHI